MQMPSVAVSSGGVQFDEASRSFKQSVSPCSIRAINLSKALFVFFWRCSARKDQIHSRPCRKSVSRQSNCSRWPRFETVKDPTDLINRQRQPARRAR